MDWWYFLTARYFLGWCCDKSVHICFSAKYIIHSMYIHFLLTSYKPSTGNKQGKGDEILTLCVLNCFRKQCIYIFYNFVLMLKWHRWLKSIVMEDKDLFILHSQYHFCWWPGVPGSHRIDLILPEYSGLSNRRVNYIPRIRRIGGCYGFTSKPPAARRPPPAARNGVNAITQKPLDGLFSNLVYTLVVIVSWPD